MATTPFSLRLDTELKAQLDVEAQELDRSASYVATKAIRAYLQAREYKRKAIDEAIEQADKGVFVSQEKVHAWMESWGTDSELPQPTPDIFSNKP